jgi:CO/xanthine dehydrogenase FAD-binding subunit
MHPFDFVHAKDIGGALQSGSREHAKFIAGGTNLVDLMKCDVEQPSHVVDINGLHLAAIENGEGGLRIGALARMSDVAADARVQQRFPAISQALLASASPQLRNMASIGGNLMQRTRCPYFRELLFAPCNKRNPGSGCAALNGDNRRHAILGGSSACIATHPSDLAVALAALDAVLTLRGSKGERGIAATAFHLLPGTTPHMEHDLRPGELIASVFVPDAPHAQRSSYLKVRDRASFEFAITSAAGRTRSRRLDDPRRARRTGRRRHQAVALARSGESADRKQRERGDVPRCRGSRARRCSAARNESIQGGARKTNAHPRPDRSLCGAAALGGGRCRMIPSIGAPRDRVDGRAKVTGAARYAFETNLDNVAYAALVSSTIPSGVITNIDIAAAKKVPGVLTILSHLNAPKLNNPQQGPPPGNSNFNETRLIPFADGTIHYLGQHIAVVVADTLEQAQHAASLINVAYDARRARIVMTDFRSDANDRARSAFSKGDADSAFASAPVKIDQTYTTPYEHHNPMEAHSITAVWDGDKLTLHDSSQNIFAVRTTLSRTFGIPHENVHVMSPFVGGAFGSKGGTWPHVLIGVLAAREVRRPVKLMVTRKQLFFANGHRPATEQRVRLGATEDGKLVSIIHDGITQSNEICDYAERFSRSTRTIYATPSMRLANPVVDLNVPTPTYMRAPGESPGMFAIESAMDELAAALKIDPIQIRLINHADADPSNGKPWSSKSLKECYARGRALRLVAAQARAAIDARRTQSHRMGHGQRGLSVASIAGVGARDDEIRRNGDRQQRLARDGNGHSDGDGAARRRDPRRALRARAIRVRRYDAAAGADLRRLDDRVERRQRGVRCLQCAQTEIGGTWRQRQ